MRTFTALECAVQSNLNWSQYQYPSDHHFMTCLLVSFSVALDFWEPSHECSVISNCTQNIDPTLTGHNINNQVIIISSSSLSHQFVTTLGIVTWPQLLTISINYFLLLSVHHSKKINLTSTGHNINIQVIIISPLFL